MYSVLLLKTFVRAAEAAVQLILCMCTLPVIPQSIPQQRALDLGLPAEQQCSRPVQDYYIRRQDNSHARLQPGSE